MSLFLHFCSICSNQILREIEREREREGLESFPPFQSLGINIASSAQLLSFGRTSGF